MDIIIRADEGCGPDPFLLWDSVWSPADGSADWAMAGADEPHNRGGLQASAALATAVTLALFSDRRVPADHPLAWLADGDPRGWWGDDASLRVDGEPELGSHLWLLERAPLTDEYGRWAEVFAQEALAPLLAAGAVVRVEAEATVHEIKNRLELLVRLYGRDGASVYDRKFDLVWDQVRL